MDDSLFSSPTPFTPPTTDEDQLLWLRLIRSRRVGPSTFWRLLAEHGSPAAALDALPGVARAAGVTDYHPFPADRARAERDAGERAGARLVFRGGPGYPPRLADLADPPPLLWALGDISLATGPTVALVGARNASSLGLRMARRLAAGLAEAGFPVVSGLARGIDAAAHEAALPAGTVAVQAGGIDVIYPSENAALAADIGRQGLRLTEQPPGLEPQARHFPQRNRIIAGLVEAVVVVEAAARSGSLITARDALDCGREVLAVPGHPVDARAAGCNQLIRDGAVLVRGVEDVIEALAGRGVTATPRTRRARPPGDGAPSPGAPAALPSPSRDRPQKLPSQIVPPNDEPAASALAAASLAAGRRLIGRMRGDKDVAPPAAVASPVVAAMAPLSQRATPTAPRYAPPPQPAGAAPPPRHNAADLRSLHDRILGCLGAAPLAEDQLIRDLALPAADLAPELLSLELEGRIERRPGGLLTRLS